MKRKPATPDQAIVELVKQLVFIGLSGLVQFQYALLDSAVDFFELNFVSNFSLGIDVARSAASGCESNSFSGLHPRSTSTDAIGRLYEVEFATYTDAVFK